MKLTFTEDGWSDYLSFQKNGKLLNTINNLIKEIKRTPYEGTGQPEALKYDFSGYWSRRIQQHRLVYGVSETEVTIIQCRHHYRE